MGQAFQPLALVVEDDANQRELVATLFEECGMKVFACESAEAAEILLKRFGNAMTLLFTDVNLAGMMSGDKLAKLAVERYPNVRVIVTSGVAAPSLPDDALFMPKPWRALEVLREAERAMH